MSSHSSANYPLERELFPTIVKDAYRSLIDVEICSITDNKFVDLSQISTLGPFKVYAKIPHSEVSPEVLRKYKHAVTPYISIQIPVISEWSLQFSSGQTGIWIRSESAWYVVENVSSKYQAVWQSTREKADILGYIINLLTNVPTVGSTYDEVIQSVANWLPTSKDLVIHKLMEYGDFISAQLQLQPKTIQRTAFYTKFMKEYQIFQDSQYSNARNIFRECPSVSFDQDGIWRCPLSDCYTVFVNLEGSDDIYHTKILPHLNEHQQLLEHKVGHKDGRSLNLSEQQTNNENRIRLLVESLEQEVHQPTV
ncbi:hypothetical protein K7432_001568 [Basidiobolus ranarum]|uniref:RFTS domain-containing protein n=1 Tax=Basidiobolus ranarum TaxID=34480 RepID=A0ABR2W9B4_9FUNG